MTCRRSWAEIFSAVWLHACDPNRKACLLERLGPPVNRLGLSVTEQLRLLCEALQKSWTLPVDAAGLTPGNTAWFEDFIPEAYARAGRPCKKAVIAQALAFLKTRAADENADAFVLVHGDAHSGNLLQTLAGDSFKLIDPDGIFYEKAYDLGVLMREWPDDYTPDPLAKGRQRCRFLHRLTGVPERAIWEWGCIQTVSTALVLLQTGQEALARSMLCVAERWTEGSL